MATEKEQTSVSATDNVQSTPYGWGELNERGLSMKFILSFRRGS